MSSRPDDGLLKEEYLFLNTLIKDYDSQMLTIKAWSITLSMFGIGSAFAVGYSKWLFLLASISSLVFWIVETWWKTFQNAHLARIKTIESYFSKEIDSIHPLQINKSWVADWERPKSEFSSIMFWHRVSLPHIVVVIGGILLFLFDPGPK